MEEKKCPGDCLLCSAHQRLYCTTQMLLNLSSFLNSLEVSITTITETLKEMKSCDSLCKPEIKET